MILTPEQITEMKERDRVMRGDAGTTLTPAMLDRAALLRDREAIAERLQAMESGIRGGMETTDRIYREHSMPMPIAARREYAERIADQLRALVTAIRGNQGDSQ